MTETGDQVPVTCPACSPAIETVHEVLSPGGSATVRCRDCGHVHAARIERDGGVRSVRTVVSQGGESLTATVEVPADAAVSTGQQFVVETDDAAFHVEVTSVEDGDGQRHERLPAADVETIWTRDVGNVTVDVTIHPGRRSGRESRSSTVQVPGDHGFAVGEETRIDGKAVVVHSILLREDASDDADRRKLDATGSRAQAMTIDRLYVRAGADARTGPW